MQVVYESDIKNLLLASKPFFLFVSTILLCVSYCTNEVFADESVSDVKVATASNFLLPLKYLRTKFEADYQYKIKISAASTTKLYAQILHGAPFDIFLSADNTTVQKLITQNKALSESEFLYAQGRLVLWSMRPKFRKMSLLKSTFLNSDFKRLALANPKTAPYGRAAMEVMNFYKVKTERGQLIFGESVGQSFQFVGSGNVDMGFVALSQLMSKKVKQNSLSVDYWELPIESYRPIDQHGVLLVRRRQSLATKKGAVAFVNYLKSEEVRQLLQNKFGYDVPPKQH